MKDLAQKLKNEAFAKRLEQSGVKINSLKKSLKEKENKVIIK